jgi:hypothetical protein
MDDYKIQLGLPVLPSEHLAPDLYGQFLLVYNALQNLLRGVSQYTGIDAPAAVLQGQLAPADTLLTGNITRLYVPAGVAINRGQAVNLFNNAGVLTARLAAASSATTLMHAVANATVLAGATLELNLFSGLLDSIGGLTTGESYYLSPTPGAIQLTRPSTAGQVIQAAGLALGSSTFYFHANTAYIQL